MSAGVSTVDGRAAAALTLKRDEIRDLFSRRLVWNANERSIIRTCLSRHLREGGHFDRRRVGGIASAFEVREVHYRNLISAHIWENWK